MSTSPPSPTLLQPPLAPSRAPLADALRFWEFRRIFYNLVLAAVVVAWLALTWPHFRPAFTLASLLFLVMLGLLANVCYCFAYIVDLAMQHSSFSATWRRWRWLLWLLGTLFAILLENYWIVDEIYPYVR
jgi:hypothetical protein